MDGLKFTPDPFRLNMNGMDGLQFTPDRFRLNMNGMDGLQSTPDPFRFILSYSVKHASTLIVAFCPIIIIIITHYLKIIINPGWFPVRNRLIVRVH